MSFFLQMLLGRSLSMNFYVIRYVITENGSHRRIISKQVKTDKRRIFFVLDLCIL